MYVKHLAWLNAVPDPPKDKKGKQGKGSDKSRAQRCRDLLKKEPEMPPTQGCEYLLKYLFRVGLFMNSGMGQINLSYQEIDAWCRRTKIDLCGWESEAIYNMSRTYVTQSAISKDPACEPPYMPNLKGANHGKHQSKS